MGLSLNLILALIAIIIVAVVLYDACRRLFKSEDSLPDDPSKSQQNTASDPLFDEIILTQRIEPDFHAKPEEETELLESESETEIVLKKQNSATPTKSIFLVLHVMSRENASFDGPNLLQALLSLGLRHGEMNIFHRLSNETPQKPLFSIASAVEPGTFDLTAIGSFTTPGITLFMGVPGSSSPLTTYDQMVELADKLAERLGGEVLDASHASLTVEKLESERAKIAAFTREVDVATTNEEIRQESS